jgi:hypothetical protein
LDIILKYTPIMERLYLHMIHLTTPTDNTCEQHVDDLAVRVKQMVIGDWFWVWNLNFKGGE